MPSERQAVARDAVLNANVEGKGLRVGSTTLGGRYSKIEVSKIIDYPYLKCRCWVLRSNIRVYRKASLSRLVRAVCSASRL